MHVLKLALCQGDWWQSLNSAQLVLTLNNDSIRPGNLRHNATYVQFNGALSGGWKLCFAGGATFAETTSRTMSELSAWGENKQVGRLTSWTRTTPMLWPRRQLAKRDRHSTHGLTPGAGTTTVSPSPRAIAFREEIETHSPATSPRVLPSFGGLRIASLPSHTSTCLWRKRRHFSANHPNG